jgi:hypothetical protein
MIIKIIINLSIWLYYHVITITTFIINNNKSTLETSFKYQQYALIVSYDGTI